MERPLHRLLALVAGLCACQLAPGATYTVGTGVGCLYSTIQNAINAAAANPGRDEIRIQQTAWTQQRLVINGHDVDLVGGFVNCTDSSPAAGTQTKLDGGQSVHVLDIEGSSHVVLRNLEITGGAAGSHDGGGIYFEGDGELSLYASWVHDNQATNGGGIAMSPSSSATLTLITSLIANNTATTDGGGLYLSGPAIVYSDSVTSISANGADSGAGGGITLVGPAQAYVTSTVDHNHASSGGGIAAISSNTAPAQINLYTTNAAHPVSIYANTASTSGGGIATEAFQGQTPSVLCAQDFSIDANIAAAGAAIAASTVNTLAGPQILINAGSPCAPPGNAPFPAVACVTGSACNELSDNQSTSTTFAAVIQLAGSPGSAAMTASRFAARRNHGTTLLSATGPANTAAAAVALQDCLLADHVGAGSLIEAYSGVVSVAVDSCTIANNAVTGATIRTSSPHSTPNHVALTNSIVFNSGASVLTPAASPVVKYVLADHTASFGSNGVGVLQGVPTFVDAAQQDYHLLGTSLGVDYAPDSGVATDLDGKTRVVDLPSVQNIFGPMDLGAYEIQSLSCAAADTIFCDGFDG